MRFNSNGLVSSLSVLAWLLTSIGANADVESLTVKKSTTTHLLNPHNWNGNCRIGWVRVRVDTEPRHGVIFTQDVVHSIGDFAKGELLYGSLNDCAGRIVNGTGVFYTPNKGFTGSDTFSVTITFEYIPNVEHTYYISVE